jgi:hypothetical protein
MATATPRILLHSVAAGTMLYGYLSLPRIGNVDQLIKSQYGQSRSPLGDAPTSNSISGGYTQYLTIDG